MKFTVKGGRPELLRTDCLILPLRTSDAGRGVTNLDTILRPYIKPLIQRGDLDDAAGTTLLLHDVAGLQAPRLLLVTIGESNTLDLPTLRKIIRSALEALLGTQARTAALLTAPLVAQGMDRATVISEAAMLAAYRAYRFNAYLSESPRAAPALVSHLAFHTDAQASTRRTTERALSTAALIAEAVNYARTLGNLPGNVCTPTYLATQARNLARQHSSIHVRILGEKQMHTLGMNAFLAVSAGSARPAQLITIEYTGTKATTPPRLLVGKGITFDTGGISLKPGPAMGEMKFDMCGAASVLGVMSVLPKLGLKENVVGLIAAAENMPSGTACRPGDIVRTMSGQSVEILNTDAEGRLVLCDTLTYAQRFKPSAVIDIATLTGAAVVALGQHATALFANDDTLAEALLEAGEHTGDRAWRLPLWDDYQQQLRSNCADMANIGGRDAGCVTAACFLSRYASQFCWAHLDIAGSAWISGANKNATGRPVRLLLHWLGARPGS